jgi:hypothetical protein
MVAHCLSHDQQEAETEEKGMVACLSHDPREADTEEKSMVDENQLEEKEEMVDQPVSNHDRDQQEETEEMVHQQENHDENLEMFDQPLSMVAHCVALYQQHQLINNDSAEQKTVISYTAESDDRLTENMGQQGKDDVSSSLDVNCVEVAPCKSNDSHQQLTQQQLHNNDDSCQRAADQNTTTLMKKASDMDDSSETAAEREDCMLGEADSMQNGGQKEDQATKEVEAVEVERLEGVTASRRESDVEEEDLESAVVFTLSLGQLQLSTYSSITSLCNVVVLASLPIDQT